MDKAVAGFWFVIVKELGGSLVLVLILGFKSFVQNRFMWAGQGRGGKNELMRDK